MNNPWRVTDSPALFRLSLAWAPLAHWVLSCVAVLMVCCLTFIWFLLRRWKQRTISKGSPARYSDGMTVTLWCKGFNVRCPDIPPQELWRWSLQLLRERLVPFCEPTMFLLSGRQFNFKNYGLCGFTARWASSSILFWNDGIRQTLKIFIFARRSICK